MRTNSIRICFLFYCSTMGLLEWGCQSGTTLSKDIDAEALFVYEVLPLIESKCQSCHGEKPAAMEGAFDMRTREGLLKGGESGQAALIPGRPKESPLYLAASRIDPDFAMPPKEGDALSAADLQILHDWIAGGAPWPDEQRQAALLAEADPSKLSRIRVPTVGGLSERWTNRRYKMDDLWAFLPLQPQEIPVEFAGQTNNPVDAFINKKLAEKDLKAAAPADKRTLLRRATFDLTGLPPTEAEIQAFLTDDSPDAFDQVIERLLASPHYGEQWGRHWLDIVRYADSGGFSNDYIRPNAWRYRDYVIRAFNEDKPYNQFVLEQLAGDEIDPDNPEMLIATGFLRMGPWEHTGMSVAAETRQFYLDDVTNIVGETFLSLPLNCAKCHDHKYDPIATKDYYQIQAVFATTQFADRPAPFLAEEKVKLSDPEKQRIADWIDRTKAEQEQMKEKEENAAKDWYRAHKRPYLPKNIRRKLPEDQHPPRYYGLSYQDLGYQKVLNKRLQTLGRTKDRFDTLAYAVYNGPNRIVGGQGGAKMPKEVGEEAAPTYILGGGSVYAPLERVEPGVLSALGKLRTALDGNGKATMDSTLPNTMNGRRLAFARWLTQEDHPMTTRSLVNRIWQYHFGAGLAGNPNNFGATGKKPTHPELLDWLAIHFVEKGWSIKDLHRLIMRSEAYQRASDHPQLDRLQRLDPANQCLAVFNPRRLEAEELRDAMLFASGELNLEVGGFPIRPEINQEVALQPRQIMGSVAQAYQPSRTPAERNRRTIYAERYRTLADPILEVFNQPGTDFSCEERTQSTVATQAFAQFNSRQTRARALAMAQRLAALHKTQEEQIHQAILQVWNRKARPGEIREAQAYLTKMTEYHQKNAPVTIEYPTEVTRQMMEEMTGEPFEYIEELDIYKDYIPDLMDKDVVPGVRAMADLAVVLFNANEFLYVY
ncbi:MAG: PSD1 and planctomycete cytochrome C domain-containing protein [Saprospiraceae bacterium]